MLHLKTIHAMKTQLLAIGYYRIQRYGNPWASLGDLHMVDFPYLSLGFRVDGWWMFIIVHPNRQCFSTVSCDSTRNSTHLHLSYLSLSSLSCQVKWPRLWPLQGAVFLLGWDFLARDLPRQGWVHPGLSAKRPGRPGADLMIWVKDKMMAKWW